MVLPSLIIKGQEDTSSVDSKKEDTFNYQYLLLDTTPIPENAVFKPVIGFGLGAFTFLGDVRDNYHGHPWTGQNAWRGSVSRFFNPFLKVHFDVTYGYLTGNQVANGQNYNFKTDIVQGGISLSYNFRNFYKTKLPINPYISLGIESFEFNSKADLYDANGYKYFYWTDGSIRNLPESPINETTSIMLQRDYKYETDLREQNLDGLGKYPMIAFGIPLDFGFEMKISHRLSMKTGATYHLTFNDNVDNITKKGADERKGNNAGDGFWFTYITFHFDLFSPPKMTIYDRHYLDVDFAALDMEDDDGDGVVDLKDEEAKTPPGAKVDSKGRALDTDEDGIPDYRDNEVKSLKNAIVDTNGETMTEEQMIALSATRPAILSDDLCDAYPSICDGDGPRRYRLEFVEIPQKFVTLDNNTDGYISVDELNKTIDQFFDLNTELSIDELYELTNFFFEQ